MTRSAQRRLRGSGRVTLLIESVAAGARRWCADSWC
jgi:hypothetical protein